MTTPAAAPESDKTIQVIEYMSNNEPRTGDVITKWDELMSRSNVRLLMKTVPQNADDETLALDKVRGAIKSLVDSMTFVTDSTTDFLAITRRHIIVFFNWMYFTGTIRVLPYNYMWEMKYRFKKLLAVAFALESMNLSSFGATPTIMTIPQSLIGITAYIRLLEKQGTFDGFVETHKALSTTYVADWSAIYTGK